MHIQQVESYSINYPVTGHFKFFVRPPGFAPGRPTVVVKITTSEGAVGWGQSVPSPRWSYETPESVKSTIDLYLAPELIGRDPHDIESLQSAMHRAIAPSFSIGQPVAKAGIDLALFDLTGKLRGQSLAQRWGRNSLASIPLSWTINPQSLEEVPCQIEQALRTGYGSFNVKVAPDVKADLQLGELVRQHAPHAFLWADANGGYDEASALAVATRFADWGFAALEQPLPANRLTGYQRLKRLSALPILMDEGVVSHVDLEEFIELDLLDGVAMKVARCGGLAEAARILSIVEERGLMFFGSGLTDPDLSLAASLGLFGAFQLRYPAALNAPQFLATSILREPPTPMEARLSVPTGPGLGVEVDESRISRDTS